MFALQGGMDGREKGRPRQREIATGGGGGECVGGGLVQTRKDLPLLQGFGISRTGFVAPVQEWGGAGLCSRARGGG